MAYQIKQDIVVPNRYVFNLMNLREGFHQGHFHSTGNPRSTVQNERDYLANNYPSANYTHLVGITNGVVDIRQVMNTNGGAFDVGGDWNWEAWFAIELVEGSINNRSDFKKAYAAYVWLGRELARQAGIPITIDNGNIAGLKTHNYASATGHGSSHVDPLPFLAKWGVSYGQFKADVLNGVNGDNTPVVPASGAVDQVLNVGEFFKAKPAYRVDDMEHINGIDQIMSKELAGGSDYNWTYNGLSPESVDKVDKNGKKTANQTLYLGDYFRLHSDRIPVVAVDEATNGVAFATRYGNVWASAKSLTEVK